MSHHRTSSRIFINKRVALKLILERSSQRPFFHRQMNMDQFFATVIFSYLKPWYFYVLSPLNPPLHKISQTFPLPFFPHFWHKKITRFRKFIKRTEFSKDRSGGLSNAVNKSRLRHALRLVTQLEYKGVFHLKGHYSSYSNENTMGDCSLVFLSSSSKPQSPDPNRWAPRDKQRSVPRSQWWYWHPVPSLRKLFHPPTSD